MTLKPGHLQTFTDTFSDPVKLEALFKHCERIGQTALFGSHPAGCDEKATMREKIKVHMGNILNSFVDFVKTTAKALGVDGDNYQRLEEVLDEFKRKQETTAGRYRIQPG